MNGQKVSSGNEVVPTRWTSVLPADRMRPARSADLITAISARVINRSAEISAAILAVIMLITLP